MKVPRLCKCAKLTNISNILCYFVMYLEESCFTGFGLVPGVINNPPSDNVAKQFLIQNDQPNTGTGYSSVAVKLLVCKISDEI